MGTKKRSVHAPSLVRPTRTGTCLHLDAHSNRKAQMRSMGSSEHDCQNTSSVCLTFKTTIRSVAQRGPVVQRYERPPCTREVGGSIPPRSTDFTCFIIIKVISRTSPIPNRARHRHPLCSLILSRSLDRTRCRPRIEFITRPGPVGIEPSLSLGPKFTQ